MQSHNVGDLFLQPLSSALTLGSFQGLEQHSSAVLRGAQHVYHEARPAVPTGGPSRQAGPPPGVLRGAVLF